MSIAPAGGTSFSPAETQVRDRAAAVDAHSGRARDEAPRRVLCYALGGGLGHLQRIARFLQRRLPSTSARLLTTSARADAIGTASPHTIVAVPAELESDRVGLRAWLAAQIADAAPDRILVDVFPCGLLGELIDFPWPADTPRWHLARLLRWEAYRDDVRAATGVDPETAPAARMPTYERCLRLEPLHGPHQAFLEAISLRQEACDLFPEDDGAGAAAAPTSDSWLVVHSGPAEEVAELIDYARDLQRLEGIVAPIRVATLDPPDRLPDGCALLADPFPVRSHLAAAACIVSAAGFNLIHETRAYRGRQRILPLPRRYDDQFERARRARSQ